MKQNHLLVLAAALALFALASCFNPIGFYPDSALMQSSGDSSEITATAVPPNH